MKCSKLNLETREDRESKYIHMYEYVCVYIYITIQVHSHIDM